MMKIVLVLTLCVLTTIFILTGCNKQPSETSAPGITPEPSQSPTPVPSSSVVPDKGFPSLSISFFDATEVHPDARGFQLADFESKQKRVFFYPWGGAKTDPLGVFLAYHTDKDFLSSTSYQAVDLTKLVDPAAEGFAGGCIDSSSDWIYFSPLRKNTDGKIENNSLALRFNTSKDIVDATAYEKFDLKNINVSRIGWLTCACLDGYVYYVPGIEADAQREHGVFLRYNTDKAFNDPSAWEYYGLILNVHQQAHGFQSNAVKYPYIYLIPFGVGNSVIVRYNVLQPFNDSASYEAFDLATMHPDAKGFTGGIVTGNTLVIVPWRDISRPSGVEQIMSVAAAFDTTKSLNDTTAWTFFDITEVSPDAKGYQFGWADRNGYVYFVPQQRGFGKVPPFIVWDSSKPFDDVGSWKTYDSTGVTPSTGAAYDPTTNTAWLAPYGSDGDSGKITRILIK